MNSEKQDTKPIQIVERIQEVVRETESIFDEIATIFPRLGTELKTSRKESEQQITQFSHSATGIGGRAHSGILLERTKSIIEEASAAYTDLHDKDDILLNTLKNDIEEIKALDSRIGEIRESSEQMELISLNAMTVAIKAGKAGGAFSYITEELKRISARSIQYTDELTREGTELDELFRTLLVSMERIENLQKDLFNNFGSFVKEGFVKAAKATDSVLTFLKTVNRDSEELDPPLMEIMEEVQQQDIIRQSLDHVLLALSELKEISVHSEEDQTTEFLDELAFLTSIPGLCIDLIEDVKKRIEKSRTFFLEKLKSIDQVMKEMESKLEKYRNENPVAIYFSEAKSSIARISDDVNSSLSMKTSIIQESEELMNMVMELQDSFIDFSELISQFQNVNVASRIEIAKQEALSTMSATVEEMSLLTGRIDETLEQALHSIKHFFKQTRDSIEMYNTIYLQEKRFSQDFDSQMKILARDVQEMLSALERVLYGFSAFTDGFYASWEKTNDVLKELGACSSRLDESTILLGQIESVFRTRLKVELEKSGNLKDWDIKNQRLQDIIERFTILEHKQKAGEIGGFDVEEGSSSGDVTFF